MNTMYEIYLVSMLVGYDCWVKHYVLLVSISINKIAKELGATPLTELGGFNVGYRRSAPLCFILLLLLMFTPVLASQGNVEFFIYVDEPSWYYHNLAVYYGERNPLFVARLLVYFNSTVGRSYAISDDRLKPPFELIGKVGDAVKAAVEKLGVRLYRVAPFALDTKSITFFLYNTTFERGVAVLKANSDLILQVYSQVLTELGLEELTDSVAMVFVKLPVYLSIGRDGALHQGLDSNITSGDLAEKITDRIWEMYGGRAPEWFYCACLGAIGVEIIIQEPGLKEEGITLRGSLDIIRQVIRDISGKDLPVIVNIAKSKARSGVLSGPSQPSIPDVRVLLAATILLAVVVATIAGFMPRYRIGVNKGSRGKYCGWGV